MTDRPKNRRDDRLFSFFSLFLSFSDYFTHTYITIDVHPIKMIKKNTNENDRKRYNHITWIYVHACMYFTSRFKTIVRMSAHTWSLINDYHHYHSQITFSSHFLTFIHLLPSQYFQLITNKIENKTKTKEICYVLLYSDIEIE